jgi:hypothetical protein
LNGVPVPRVATVQVGDQIRIDDEYVLHVSAYERPYVGPPRSEHMDVECPLCRLRIGTHTTGVCECSNCDAVLHCEGPEKSADERLECARLTSECPCCQHPIRLTAGFAYVPEF